MATYGLATLTLRSGATLSVAGRIYGGASFSWSEDFNPDDADKILRAYKYDPRTRNCLPGMDRLRGAAIIAGHLDFAITERIVKTVKKDK